MKRLSESFVDDIIRRGINREDRIEDDIDLLDRDAFCEYLKKLYTVTERNMDIENVIGSIQVPISRMVSVDILYNDPDKVKAIFITFGRMILPDELVNILQTKYKAANPLSKLITISWNGEPIPNKICIEIIDLLLKYTPRTVLKKNISESFVDDIIRRGITGEDRKEDDVDGLDQTGFYEYLTARYECIGGNNINIYKEKEITIPIIRDTPNSTFVLSLYYHNNNIEDITMSEMVFEKYPKLEAELNKVGKVIYGNKYKCSNYYQIHLSPKDGKLSNKIAIEFLDCILDNVDKPEMKRIGELKESFVDDIIRRGITGEERAEDDIELLDIEGLYNYLNTIYTKYSGVNIILHNDSGDNFISIPIVRDSDKPYFLFYDFKKRGKEISMVHEVVQRMNSFFVLVKDEYEVDTIEDYDGRPAYISIEPKDGSKVNNKFLIEVIDKLLSFAKTPLLKKKEV